MNAYFFDISKEKIFLKIDDRKFGSLFLKCRNTSAKITIFDIITPPDHTPVSQGSGVTGSIPGIFTVSDARINAGNITETKLITTIDMENRNTIHDIKFERDLCTGSFFFAKSKWIISF